MSLDCCAATSRRVGARRSGREDRDRAPRVRPYPSFPAAAISSVDVPTPPASVTVSPLALVCERLGEDLSGLRVVPCSPDTLGPQQVRVAMSHAAVHFPDLLMLRGAYQFKPELPFVPGLEGAGVITACGAAVTDWRVGDPVNVMVRHGTMAQELVCDTAALSPWPSALRAEQAACFAVNGLTAVVALERLARLDPGETVLVHGARGGVGAACVALALHRGARVLATATQPESLADLVACGVRVLDARTAFAPAVLEATGGRGADVVCDPVGGEVFHESTRCIAFGGRLLVLGFASGTIPTLAANRALIKGFSLIGVRAGEYGRRDPVRGAENRERVSALAQAGVLCPQVALRVPLHEAASAFRALASRAYSGRIVLDLSSAR